jgi:hypothetical protein
MAGGVLGLVVLAGLIGWGLGRSSVEDRPTSALAADGAAVPGPSTTTTVAPETIPPGAEGDLVPPELFEGLPEDLADELRQFLDSLPEGAGERFFIDPEGFLERFEPQFGGDLEEFFGPGGLEEFFGQNGLEEFFGEGRFFGPDGSFEFPPGAGRLGLLDDQLQAFGLPPLEGMLPEGATLRGLSFSGGRSTTGQAVELAIRFEVDGTPAELVIDSADALDPDLGSAVDLNGTPARLVDDAVVWEIEGGVTLTLRAGGLDTEALIELATDIDGSLR